MAEATTVPPRRRVSGKIILSVIVAAVLGTIVYMALLNRNAVTITSGEFGAAWPFYVTEGTLRCERVGGAQVEAVTLETSMGTYSVNGLGDQDLPSAEALVRPELRAAEGDKALYPIIDRGRALCK